MARPAYAVLPLLLAAYLLFQVSDCSRPSPEEPPVPTSSPPAVHRDEAAPRRSDAETGNRSVEMADDARSTAEDGAAPPSAVTSSRDEDGARSRQRSGAVVRELRAPPLRSKLARRFLAAKEEAGTDGAGPSCHSYNAHNACPPPSKR